MVAPGSFVRGGSFREDFTPISARQTVQQGPMTVGAELALSDGRITGNVSLPEPMGGHRAIDAEGVPNGRSIPVSRSLELQAIR